MKTKGARLQDRLIRTLNPRPDLGERNRKKKREEGDSNRPEISPNPNPKIPILVRRSRSGTGKEKRERLTDPDRIGKEQTVTLPLTVISNQERKDGLEGVFSYLGIPCAVTTACRRTGRRAGQGTVARLLGSGPLSHGRARALTKSPTAAPALHLQSAIMDGCCSFHGWTASGARTEEKGREIDRLAGWRLAAEAAAPPRSCRRLPPPFHRSRSVLWKERKGRKK